MSNFVPAGHAISLAPVKVTLGGYEFLLAGVA